MMPDLLLQLFHGTELGVEILQLMMCCQSVCLSFNWNRNPHHGHQGVTPGAWQQHCQPCSAGAWWHRNSWAGRCCPRRTRTRGCRTETWPLRIYHPAKEPFQFPVLSYQLCQWKVWWGKLNLLVYMLVFRATLGMAKILFRKYWSLKSWVISIWPL